MNIDTSCSSQLTSVGITPYFVTTLLNTLIQGYCKLNVAYPPDQSTTIKDDEEFDFIVIGAGSAGSPIASRLSEVPQWRVLLIEAGPDPPVEAEIPALFTTMLKSKVDWFYQTERSEEACRSMVNNQCTWPKGKMLGGSSSINGMFYVRGNEHDYNEWSNQGNIGWAYKDILKYFQKLEKVESEGIAPCVHGKEGYLEAKFQSNSSFYHAQIIDQKIHQAAMELGLPFIEDCSSRVTTCVSRPLFNIIEGQRTSTAKAFLIPAKDRKNLIIMKNTFATKLLIDEEKKHVYGVEVHTNGKFMKLLSKKEVIVSAGSVASPQLLMLSGIGPKEDLETLGIPVVKDLKVGYNVQDHIFVVNFYAKLNFTEEDVQPLDPMYYYLTRRTETMAAPFPGAIIFMNTKNLLDRPNLQIHFLSFTPKNALVPQFLDSMNFKPHVKENFIEVNQDSYLVSFMAKIIQPKSRGKISIYTTNPFVPPKIVHGYLTEQEDVVALREGCKFARRMMKTKHFEGTELYTIPTPECDRFDKESDQFYECYARNFVNTVYHAAGSVKMGPTTDPLACVDHQLKVYGVSGVRVADASIMPTIVSGNTNIPTIMIGEKASDMIKKDWLQESEANG